MSKAPRSLLTLVLLIAVVGLVTSGCRGSVSGQNTDDMIVVTETPLPDAAPAPVVAAEPTPEPAPAPEPAPEDADTE